MSEPKERNYSKVFVDNKWKPGQSGNPGGRPKKRTLADEVIKTLEAHIAGADGVDRLEVLARVVVQEAIEKRNTAVLKLLMDRLWPASTKVEVIGESGDTEFQRPVIDIDKISPARLEAIQKTVHDAIQEGIV